LKYLIIDKKPGCSIIRQKNLVSVLKMNKFKINSKFLIIFSIFIFTGCENIFQSKPQDVLIKYLEADLVGDHKKAYNYISAQDKKKKSLEKYIREKSKNDGSELLKLIIDKTTFKILNEKINGNTANVEVATTTVDMNIITNEVANAAMQAATTGKTFEDVQSEIAEKYKKQQLPLNTYKSSYNLVKQENKWKIVLNL